MFWDPCTFYVLLVRCADDLSIWYKKADFFFPVNNLDLVWNQVGLKFNAIFLLPDKYFMASTPRMSELEILHFIFPFSCY